MTFDHSGFHFESRMMILSLIFKSQVIFSKRAINQRALLREMTCKNKAFRVSSVRELAVQGGEDVALSTAEEPLIIGHFCGK